MRRIVAISLVCLSLLSVPSLACALPDIIINFDDITAAPSNFILTNPLRDEYASKGVHFRGPSDLDGGAVLDVLANFGTPAYSGSKFLAFNPNATMANKGKPLAPEIILFDNLWQTVSIYVSGGLTEDLFSLEAFGPDGVSVGQATIITKAFAPLSFTSAQGISKIILSSGNDGIFVADDLELTTRVPEPGTMLLLGLGIIGIGVLRRRN
jgi:hypothetical protein